MRNEWAWFLILFSTSVFSQITNIEKINAVRNVSRIAFGSCNDQNDPQPLWKDLATTKPDLFIWGGDAIYADWESSYNLKSSYLKQFNHKEYKKFRSTTPIIGTWDDHDYAFDNANGTLQTKDISKKHFLDFLEEPEDSLRRIQQGVYTSYEFLSNQKKIKIILLDNRYFKGLDPEAPLLGKTQWRWLEQELKTSTAEAHFIMTGLSVFSPLIPYSEEWSENSVEINRMLHLLKTYNPKGVMFLTGDKHFASIFQRYGQLEFMASGMTHVAPRETWWYLGRKYPTTYFGLNYGLIDIGWDGSNPVLTLSIRTPSGADIHKSRFRWENTSWAKL